MILLIKSAVIYGSSNGSVSQILYQLFVYMNQFIWSVILKFEDSNNLLWYSMTHYIYTGIYDAAWQYPLPTFNDAVCLR